MRPYFAHLKITILLVIRNRSQLLMSYLLPVLFFFMYAIAFGGGKNPGAMNQAVNMVLVLCMLSTGLFGSGVRAVQERENNILRRYKVTPPGAAPIVIASLTAGLITYIPVTVGLLVAAHFWFSAPFPDHLLSFFIFSCLGFMAFRGIGLIIAAVTNTMQEITILVQLLYLPMLLLSGATLPLDFLPLWLQRLSAFIPASYLFAGLQSISLGQKGLAENWTNVTALVVSTAAATILAIKLFRWDKDEPIPPRAKLWIPGIMVPFFLLGIGQIVTKDQINQNKRLARKIDRQQNYLIQNVRIFVGDGRIIQRGAVLIKNGRIVQVSNHPLAGIADAERIDGTGDTILPALIDMDVHLNETGLDDPAKSLPNPQKELAAYLYCGIATVRSMGDYLEAGLAARSSIDSASWLGASPICYGPSFTAENGDGTRFLHSLPRSIRQSVSDQLLRIPDSPGQAQKMVQELQQTHADGISILLNSNPPFQGIPSPTLEAILGAAKSHLPVSTRVGNIRDLESSLASRTVEGSRLVEKIPDTLLEAMKRNGVAYDPGLSGCGANDLNAVGRDSSFLTSPLLQEVVSPEILSSLKNQNGNSKREGNAPLPVARENLLDAWNHGVELVAGSGAGSPSVIHGPTIQRELQLWVASGIPASVALQAATWNAARVLDKQSELGLVAPDHEATLLMVQGDPTQDIKALQVIDHLFFRGGMLDRATLLNQE